MNKSLSSKLSKLKNWWTLPDAAKYLSGINGDEVTEAEILLLALEGHLKLSIRFVNQASARRGTVVGRKDVQWGAFSRDLEGMLPNLVVEAEGEILRYMKSVKIDDTRFLNLSEEVTTIEGVWDLHMVGGGRLNIEDEYQRLTGGPRVNFQDLGGPIVESSDGVMYQLGKNHPAEFYFTPDLIAKIAKLRELELSQSEEDLFTSPRRSIESSKHLAIQLARYKREASDKLPEDSVLVLRSEVLEDFKQRMLDSEEGKNTVTKPHGNIEKNAAKREQVLGAAFAVLAKWLEKCRDAKGNPAATKIASMIVKEARLFWPDAQPPLATDSIADHLRDWIKKVNISKK